jgi:CheY-like chemotaxis protein
MLKILWVEDQLGGKQADFFGDRSVTLITNFDDAEKAINSCLQEFDLVVLDINLEESPISQNIQERAKNYGLEGAEFLKECGMSLFLNLLENGFPKERIIFLTANSDEKFDLIDRLEAARKENNLDEMDAIIEEIQDYLDDERSKKCGNLIESGNVGELIVVLREYFDGARSGSENTYNTFCEAYKRCRIKPPEAINKNLKVKIHLNRWIGRHENNQYLMLRRGIVEGCDYLRNKSSRFSSYSASPDKNNDFDLSSYMDILSGFFLITESYNLSHQYKLFIRTLAHEWDDAVRPKKLKLDGKENSQVSLAFSWIMKMTRNWSAHSKVFEGLSAQDVAFLFIVNMRAMFELGSELAPYEKYLLNLFESPLEVEAFKSIYGMDFKDKRKFGNYFEERKIPLIQSYARMLDK